jgi:hypothetical protein
MAVTTRAPLEFYAAIGAALFPIQAGSKAPTGIIQSFVSDWSRDPAQWQKWAQENPSCNFGLVAGPSRLIIVDTDAKGDRDAAWATRRALFAEWGVPADVMPYCQTARLGWHDAFAVPENVDAATLRQPDAIRGIVNVRAGNGHVVTAGSYYDGTAKGEASGHYVLMSDAAPTIAPAALIKHCTCAERTATAAVSAVGARDAGDVAALLRWLNERDSFSSYEDWCSIGMALRLEYGDAGLDLWRLTHDNTVTADVEVSKWQSFATQPTPNCVTLNTWLQRAHKLGWRGNVGKSTAAMFGQIAQMAHAAGATLPVGTPGPSDPDRAAGMPMLEGQARLAETTEPLLSAFLDVTKDSPTRPLTNDYPQVPDSVSGHALYRPLRDTVDRLVALAEADKSKFNEIYYEPLAVLQLVHADTCNALVRKLRALGWKFSATKIKAAAERIYDDVYRTFRDDAAWVRDEKTGKIENDNSDNVGVLFEVVEARVRWNAWLEIAEIIGGKWDGKSYWPEWKYVDDTVISQLRTRANRTGTRFNPAKDFFWDALISIAHRSEYDPAMERLAALEAAWDRMPRLSTWLTAVGGLQDDTYTRAVARNIVGGLVRRIRKPGAKHDTAAVLLGPEGTGKSTLAALIADMGQSTLAELDDGKGVWFSDTVKLGDEAKELVLSLAGVCVAEIGEMGMRNNADAADVKAMVSRQDDKGRTAYARSVSTRKRRNIFLGTTNELAPLTSTTGNRRFLPLQIQHPLKLDWMAANICQILGEAAALESQGDKFNIPPAVWSIATAHQEAARSQSDIEILFNEWFAEVPSTAIAFITAADLTTLCNMAGQRSGNASRGVIMTRLGFRPERPYLNGKQCAVWFRGPSGLPRMIEQCAQFIIAPNHVIGRPQVLIRLGNSPPLVPPQTPEG